MATEPTAAEIRAEKRRKAFVRALIVMVAIAVVLGVVGAFLGTGGQVLCWGLAYVAGFAAVMTLLYAFWHNIVPLPGTKDFNAKVASGEIVETEAPVKKKKPSADA